MATMKTQAPAAGEPSPRKRMAMGNAPSGAAGVSAYDRIHGGKAITPGADADASSMPRGRKQP